MSTTPVTIACPYCGEAFETAVDGGDGDEQRYIEDCAVCCRPITFVVVAADRDSALSLRILRDDDTG